MKFGVNTFIWSDQFDESVESLLPTLRERGFDGVEVPLFRPAEFPGMNIRKASTGSDLECTVCSVLTSGLSLISNDVEIIHQESIHHGSDTPGFLWCGCGRGLHPS